MYLVDGTQFLRVHLGKEFHQVWHNGLEPHTGDVRVLECDEVSFASLRKERVADDSVQT